MNIYKNPESKIQNKQEINSVLNKGTIASRTSLGMVIFLMFYNFVLTHYISVTQDIYIIISLIIFLLYVISFVCGVVGLIGYFKSRNKYTFWFSLMGVVVTTYFLGTFIFYTIESVFKFNAAS